MTNSKKISACILAVGDELTTGQSLDTNSAWLSQQLGFCGIETLSHATVPDDQSVIADTIARLAESADIVIVTGGLGPTPDDLTRQGLAEAMGVKLVLNAESLARTEAFFQGRNVPMSPNNRIQAMIPAGAAPLTNSTGTAPGITASLGKAAVYITPGVPREMKLMFREHILPKLPKARGVILHNVVKMYGAGESAIAATLEDLLTRSGPVVVGTTVADGLISLRITSKADDIPTAQKQTDSVVEKICRRLGELILGVGEDASMPGAIGKLLPKFSQTLATAESCTGGMIGRIITSVGGSSDFYRGGIVAYSDDVKRKLLGVDPKLIQEHGAVSRQVAGAMASGVQKTLAADWGIGITGIAGPTGNSDEKPVGLVYTSLCDPKGNVSVKKHMFGSHNSREIIRQRASLAALNALRLELIKMRDKNQD